ncbi:alkaline phosphatase [Flexibacter flexilis DSM 6793]|uniref:Alkaline phosphatase n=1 Tax=Flexibacter flexilis DSM 6793 TaxID=927664 RepID=A0A1I1JYF9_9BACT|nr:alkaline phosphatase [Flexibacter flexilis]SFC53526.1 alkaline phosphatase [Flexibacter flexilis DSM 6793]
MERKDFLRLGGLAAAGTMLGFNGQAAAIDELKAKQKAKNVIILVSDGMSIGTLNMADLFLQRKEGRGSYWLDLYRDRNRKITRALMDTASASSLVTDSAAASSSWGGGVRVKNGSLNVGANGEFYKPIWQKMKAAGKAVGCVTTVPITHATPAGFCVNNKSRKGQPEIAEKYLELRFDVMMGGGLEHFTPEGREDKKDMFSAFTAKDFAVVRDRSQMLNLNTSKPILGVFHEDGLPYSIDRNSSAELQAKIPTLAEMTQTAIKHLKGNPKGFALQVEGGKVDWAAHGNDIGALLYDQIAFDEAVKVALDFAEKDKETLVIITTDHGNANPGLIYGEKANQMFDSIQKYKQSNDWILSGVNKFMTAAQVIERVEAGSGFAITTEQANDLLGQYQHLDEDGLYNPRKMPFKKLAEIQGKYNSVGWISMDHSADFVELAMYGVGSELLPSFIKNTDLHYLMLNATHVEA